MRDKVIDVLLDVGVPAGVKGFSYICDAIEIFDTDPYYADGKCLHCILTLPRRTTQPLPVLKGQSVMLLKLLL